MRSAGMLKCLPLIFALPVLFCPAAGAELVKVPAGTPVKLALKQPLSTKSATAGQVVDLVVAEDVWVGTSLVIPAGQASTAKVTSVEKPGKFGKSGRLSLEFGQVAAADGSAIGLGQWQNEKDASRGIAAGASIGASALLGPIGIVGGLFVKGKDVELAEGQQVSAAVRWDSVVQAPEGQLVAAAVLPPEDDAPSFVPNAGAATGVSVLRVPPANPEPADIQPLPAPVPTPRPNVQPLPAEPVDVQPVTLNPPPVKPEPIAAPDVQAPADAKAEEDVPAVPEQEVRPVIPIIEDLTGS